jgi:hypothetical protein
MNRIGRRISAAVNPVSTAATRWWCHSAIRHTLTGRAAMRDSVVTAGSAQLRDQASRAVVTESEVPFGCHNAFLAHNAKYARSSNSRSRRRNRAADFRQAHPATEHPAMHSCCGTIARSRTRPYRRVGARLSRAQGVVDCIAVPVYSPGGQSAGLHFYTSPLTSRIHYSAADRAIHQDLWPSGSPGWVTLLW